MSRKIVTVTGGSGFVGQILRRGLRARGYEVRVFDRYRSPLVTFLNRRYLGTVNNSVGQRIARRLRCAQRRLDSVLRERGLIGPTRDDILDMRCRLIARFKGSYAVIHLAGIAHPLAPGSIDDDFRRINYDGSVNAFEAASVAGAQKFLFASSAQVYKINRPVRIDQFPILETNYLPGMAEGQSMYGFLKAEFERYLATACPKGNTQGIALRLEYPGFCSNTPGNFYISTSVENLQAGVIAALEAPESFSFEAFNLADHHVDPAIIDVQAFLQRFWRDVPNHTHGNDCLLSTDKAQRLLGYRPTMRGTYYNASIIQ